MKPALAMLCTCLAMAAPATQARDANDFGRLFLTPEERAQLDERRRSRVPDRPEVAPVIASPVTRVDGFVQRKGGKSTVWVNGQAIREGSRNAPARIVPRQPGSTSVTLGAPEEAREAQVRVGQAVDSETGEVRDPLGDGEIRVKRPAQGASTRQ